MKNINIVLIHTHDTGRYISPYGYNAKTNNIQKIANKGSVYRNFFTAAPTCSPSRSSLMTVYILIKMGCMVWLIEVVDYMITVYTYQII